MYWLIVWRLLRVRMWERDVGGGWGLMVGMGWVFVVVGYVFVVKGCCFVVVRNIGR